MPYVSKIRANVEKEYSKPSWKASTPPGGPLPSGSAHVETIHLKKGLPYVVAVLCSFLGLLFPEWDKMHVQPFFWALIALFHKFLPNAAFFTCHDKRESYLIVWQQNNV